MTSVQFDLVVIGGGPGGYVAAIRAAQFGLKVALVEEDNLGGICLNWGCIPTKALLRTAELYRNFQHAEQFGLQVSEVGFEVKNIFRYSRKVAQRLSRGVAHLLKKNTVTVIDGHGKLLGNGQVQVTKGDQTTTLSAKHIVLATGASPKFLPGLDADGKKVWSYKHALAPDSIPSSLIVVGSGAIGLEFASFYQTFGAQVTVVEILEQILPNEDHEIAEHVQKAMSAEGLEFHTGARITDIQNTDCGLTMSIEKEGQELELSAAVVLSAVGVQPNVAGIGLEDAGVQIDDSGFIQTDAYCRTSVDGVYAVGDVAGAPCLAHKASHEAVLCIEKIAGQPEVESLNKDRIPACTYSAPNVASVGLTEQGALDAGYMVRIGRFPFQGNGKAVVLGEPAGLVKTIFDARNGELLGAHMVGPEVTELIQGFCIAQSLESTEQELLHTVFAHPTLSEAMHESVLSAYDRALHV